LHASSPRVLKDLLRAIPKQVTVSHEVNIGRKATQNEAPAGGRLDLAIQGRGFFLAVEAKIGASLMLNQLEGYLRHPAVADNDTAGGLILVTRDRADVPSSVWRDDNWLGQVSWEELVPELAKLTPANKTVAEQWKTILEVVQRPGDLAAEYVAWQRNRRTVTIRNRAILRSIRNSSCQLIEQRLAERRGWTQSEALCGHRRPGPHRVSVTSHDGDAYLELFVPADASTPALRVELAGRRQPLKLFVFVEQPAGGYRRKSKKAELASRLAEAGFAFSGHDCWVMDRVGDGGIGEPPPVVLRRVLERRLTDIIGTGVLDHLVK